MNMQDCVAFDFFDKVWLKTNHDHDSLSGQVVGIQFNPNGYMVQVQWNNLSVTNHYAGELTKEQPTPEYHNE